MPWLPDTALRDESACEAVAASLARSWANQWFADDLVVGLSAESDRACNDHCTIVHVHDADIASVFTAMTGDRTARLQTAADRKLARLAVSAALQDLSTKIVSIWTHATADEGIGYAVRVPTPASLAGVDIAHIVLPVDFIARRRVDSLPPTEVGGVEPLQTAIGRQTVKAGAHIGSVSVTLKALSEAAKSKDALILGQRLDQPLSLTLNGRMTSRDCLIVQSEFGQALRLLSEPEAPSHPLQDQLAAPAPQLRAIS